MIRRDPYHTRPISAGANLESQLRGRLRISIAFRLAAPAIAVITFFGCIVFSWETVAGAGPCLLRAAIAGLAAFGLIRLVGRAVTDYWGRHG